MSLLRVWQEYGKEQARSSLEYGKEQARSRLGAGKSMLRVCLGHAGRIQAEFGENSRRIQGEFRLNSQRMHLLRFVACLILIVVGVGEMWGQDYSGTYFIASDAVLSNKHIYNADDHTNNYYLCPTEGWISFNSSGANKDTWKIGDDKPFLTTYKVNLHVNDQAPLTPYDITKAKWTVEYYTTEDEKDYYYIKHSSGKYLVLNKQIDGVSGSNSQLRIRVHLESLNQADLENNEATRNNALFRFSRDGNDYLIDPKTQYEYYLTVNKGNGDYLHGENRDNGATITSGSTTYGLAGTVGIFKGANDATKYFYLEEIIPRPTFTNSSSQININHSEENTTIYYTTDGSNPTTTHYNGQGPAPLQINMPENSVTIKAIAAGTDNLPSCISKIRVVPAANITLESSPIVYNGSAQEPTVIVKDGETIIPSDEYTVSYSNNNINAGETVTVTITDKEGGDYIVYGSTTFTINPKPVAITANDASKTYNGSALTEAGFTSGELEAGDTHSFAVTMTEGSTITNVGTQPNVIATVDGVAVTTGTEIAVGNYLVTTANGTLTINPKAVTITANNASKEYDGTALTESGFTTSALETGDTHTFTVAMTAGSTITDVGYTPNVIATVDGTAVTTGTPTAVGNYTVTTANGTLTVSIAHVTLTANSGTETYDRTEKTVSGYTCNIDGLTFPGVSASRSETNAGTYEVTFTGVTVNTTTDDTGNYVVAVATPGTLTINPKTLTITPDADQYKGFGDDDPVLTYTYSGLVEGDEIAFNGALGREEGEDVGTYEINLYNLTSANSNYVLALTEEPVVYFTIMKSVGNESMAEGFKLEIGAGGDIILKDGETLLAEGTDYTISTPEPGKYTERTVSGSGSYTGSFTFTNANVNFQTDADRVEWSATFVAEPIGGEDADDTKGHALPDGMKAFIITDIDGDWAIPEQLAYIPEGVPVLLVSDKESGGFVVENATPTDEQKINDTQKGANMLKVTTSTTHFDIKTIFLLYKNEFIYNMSGDLAAGKVYLNPPSGSSPAPSRLRIKKKDDTGIEDTHFLPLTSHLSDVWYTLDGRRLNGKPMERGLYINEGKKIFIK